MHSGDSPSRIARRHPDEQGEVRQCINVFVGEESIRFGSGLARAVPDNQKS